MEFHQLQKRVSYLERALSSRPAEEASAPAPAPVAEVAAPVSVQTISPELEKEVKSQMLELKTRVEAMEQTIAGLLDRVINLKEKLQPSFDITVLENRIISLEEVTSALVGMGRS